MRNTRSARACSAAAAITRPCTTVGCQPCASSSSVYVHAFTLPIPPCNPDILCSAGKAPITGSSKYRIWFGFGPLHTLRSRQVRRLTCREEQELRARQKVALDEVVAARSDEGERSCVSSASHFGAKLFPILKCRECLGADGHRAMPCPCSSRCWLCATV